VFAFHQNFHELLAVVACASFSAAAFIARSFLSAILFSTSACFRFMIADAWAKSCFSCLRRYWQYSYLRTLVPKQAPTAQLHAFGIPPVTDSALCQQ